VPVTLQTFAVALLAAAFGWRVGVATVVAYLVEGAIGVPVFATGGGMGYLVGPTGGFLLGFIPMAYIIGRATDLGGSSRVLMLVLAMLIGDVLLFVFGYAWLLALGSNAAWLDQSDLLGSAFAKAVQPFIVWDILKMVFAALTVSGLWAAVRKRT
jgi:biotin transport system substrate-specific component